MKVQVYIIGFILGTMFGFSICMATVAEAKTVMRCTTTPHGIQYCVNINTGELLIVYPGR